MISHYLICDDCNAVQPMHIVEYGQWTPCACGGKTQPYYGEGKPCATDVLGCAVWSDPAGAWITSQSQKKKICRENEFYEGGDRVHGARPDHRRKHTAISYVGQGSRQSTAERSA